VPVSDAQMSYVHITAHTTFMFGGSLHSAGARSLYVHFSDIQINTIVKFYNYGVVEAVTFAYLIYR